MLCCYQLIKQKIMKFKKEFEHLLATTTLSSDATSEKVAEVWDSINKLLLPNIPQQLFRFRTCSLDSVLAFQSGEISTCVARAFKDKYDSLVYVNKTDLEKKLSGLTQLDVLFDMINDEDFCKIFEAILGKERVEQARKEAAQCSKEEWLETASERIAKLIEYTLSLIDSNVDYVRNDPFSKIACFSEDIRSLRMWDTYADGYSGFALEYDFRDFHTRGCWACTENCACQYERRNFSHLFPIIYTDKRFDATDNVVSLVQRNLLSEMGIDKCPPIDQLYWYKPYLYKNAESYAHEKEWRLISHCPNCKVAEYTNISDLGTMKAIYYGPNIEKRYKDFLHEVAKMRGLKEYDVYTDPYSPDYELKIRPFQ